MREERPVYIEQPIRYNYVVLGKGTRRAPDDIELQKDRRGRGEPRLHDTVATAQGTMTIAEIFWHSTRKATVALKPAA